MKKKKLPTNLENQIRIKLGFEVEDAAVIKGEGKWSYFLSLSRMFMEKPWRLEDSIQLIKIST